MSKKPQSERENDGPKVACELDKWKALSQRVDWKTEIARQRRKLPKFKYADEDCEKLGDPFLSRSMIVSRNGGSTTQ